MFRRTKRIIVMICVVSIICVPGVINGWGQQAPQAKTGKLEGMVYNVATGDPLIKASIEIVSNGNTVETGINGTYSLDLPPGTYTIRFFREGFVEQTLENVIVTAGATKEMNAVLSPVGYGESVTINAGNSNDVAMMLEDRKSATTVSDTISAVELSKDTSSNAAGVLQRVPGVSIVDRFVFVRGLGERYSNTSLNDALLPTTEPDRRVVPMDLIPTNLLQSVKILKTFTPDQPGEFSGGLVRLETIEFPKATSFAVKISTGFNTKTQGREFFGYAGDGGLNNFFGFGKGRRELPSVIPQNRRVLTRNIINPSGFTPEELERLGESFKNVWSPREESARPEFGWSLSGGTTFGKVGVVGALSFKNELQTLDERRNFFQLSGVDTITPNATYDYDSSARSARLGGTLNTSYELTKNNKLFFKNFLTNQATDETRIFEGFNSDRGSVLRNFRLRYIEEQIYTGQFSGSHLIGWLGNSVLAWRYTYSRAALDEPDLRESLYEFNPTVNDFIYFPQTQSLFRLFNEMRENVREPAFDLAKFWIFKGLSLNAKGGFSYINRDRVFDSRRFRFRPLTGATIDIDTTLAPEQILTAENIRPDRGFELREETRNTDHYDALHNVTAGYLMADVTFGRWRMISGARVERSQQKVFSFEPFNPDFAPIVADLKDTDVLPSLGIVYALKNGSMNLRTGYSKTVSRPQFRELSPFEFTDVTGGRSAVGNPDLTRTLITNYDIRWEWFYSPSELVAVSVFHKDLDDPIEIVAQATTVLRTSWANVEKARNTGVEIEFRKNLGQWWNRFQNFSTNVNYTYVRSRVDIGEENRGILTSVERPLVGQARNLLNFSLDYEKPQWGFESRALFNYTGERISDVGAFGLPDIIEHGYPHLDMSFAKGFGAEKRFRAEFQIENLLNRQIDYRLDNQAFRVYRTGRTFEFGVSYKFY